MEIDYLDIGLWLLGSVIAVATLMSMMRRRRDQLVEQLKDYVEQNRSANNAQVGEETE